MKRAPFFILILIVLLAAPFARLNADTASDVAALQSKIDERNRLIAALDADIKNYQGKIGETDAMAKTLKNAIASIDLQIKKLQAQISSTQAKIGKTDLTIRSLSDTISDHESKIAADRLALAKSLREAQSQESRSPIEAFLSDASLSSVWQQLDALGQFRQGVASRVDDLQAEKSALEGDKAETQAQKDALVKYKSDLADQQKLVQGTKADKSTLLAQTKDQESQYRKILDQKNAARAQTEQELFDYESQLKTVIDPSRLPGETHGILSWPLDNVRITQLFGKTEDSGRLYVSGTHNGVDFAAAKGTPVKAVLSGTITATGNTDLVKGCYSYGQWVLIDHHDGLSTIYGHLSLIKATPGQAVATGDVIGYSGATGYATGPHLHLGLFATQGVQVAKYSNSINCKGATIPLSPIMGYLDPMAYLPKQ